MPKKGKKGPKTEEEKLLMLQHKMMAEEEEHRKKERLLNQFLKDKLAKEEHNSSLNLNKINTQWRMVLREVKARELRKDIEILSQTFERVVDCKNSVIKVSSVSDKLFKIWVCSLLHFVCPFFLLERLVCFISPRLEVY
uniref:Dynein regulatory complex subunit 2 n=1 Tax=Monodelphis domestica TaxID=13616 RepID=A0A5F8GV17_MONDO